MPMNRRFRFVSILLLVLTAGILAGMGLGEEKEAEQVREIVITDQSGFTTLISEVAEELTPAVVHINVSGTVVQRAPDSPFFRYFFDIPEQREIPVQSLGSGVIIDSEGHIITNNHVIQNADEIEVVLHDGSSREAEVVGADPSTDLAVLKIEPAEDMMYARFGDSDEVRIGEWVIAIGSPRGFERTVTAGIVSAKNRRNIGVLGPQGYEDFIQTDAAINPGNSGGPLLNLEGEIIGINALIVSASRGSEGMGFAIPSNMAKDISESLIQTGTVVRGYLGVQIQDLTPEMAESLDLDRDFEGVIVADVTPDSPADRGGVEQGDVIVRFDGEDIEDVSELRNEVAETQPGTSVDVVVYRDEDERTLDVEVGDLSEYRAVQARRTGTRLGLTLQPVDSEMAEELGMTEPVGLVVTNVQQGTPAAAAGISRGDIILKVGRQTVRTVGEYERYVEQMAQTGTVLLLVRDGRSGQTMYVTIPVS
jgi:serine protease Do